MGLNVYNSDSTLTTSAATCITCPAASQITILKATVCNTDTVARTVTIYRVASGGSPGLPMIDALALGAGETVVLPLSGQTLVGGQTLQALASVASVVQLSVGYAQTP